MSNRYQGGILSATPPTLVAGAGASGAWTLEQQMRANAAGLWPTNGPFYIEDVFSTYLYTGTGATQTITNGIDLSTKGGMLWIKNRSNVADHGLWDTVRGSSNRLRSNTTNAQGSEPSQVTGFTSSGFSLGTDGASNSPNFNGSTFVSWTFREQAKFFDVVTYTGDGNTTQAINHNLGSVPGCIIVKRTDSGTNWFVYHRNLTSYQYSLYLNDTTGEINAAGSQFGANPTSTQFTVGSGFTNTNGGSFVAYIFAHDAGGFGLTGADNVISCGSFTTSGSGSATVSLGYEPQWVLFKSAGSADNWIILDNMRGWANNGTTGSAEYLYPNTSGAAGPNTAFGYPTATGFQVSNQANSVAYIYIAIRRGPMEVPTDGTTVFSPVAYTGDNSSNRVIGSLPAGDSALVFTRNYNDYAYPQTWWSRLTGGLALRPYNSNAEVNQATTLGWDNQVGQLISVGSANINYGGSPAGNFILYDYKRAPGYFDVVCYTGTGVARTVTHNLAAVPELMIVKYRNSVGNWIVYTAAVGNTQWLRLNTSDSLQGPNSTYFNSTTPTSTVFTVGSASETNGGGDTYVAYLFATCPGVSKVGSYTGTAATLQINCGFTAGSRFVLIKRTDSTGDWYVWDSARGIVAGNDPYLLLNSLAAEVTGTDYVDTYNAGFELTSTAPAALNASGGTYIFLAIA